MKYNYHTHTGRCNHASGSDAEYANAAYSEGFLELGFADHVPQPGFEGIFESWFRMKPWETEQYFSSVRSLADKYKGKMNILAGFEVEFYPKHFDAMMDHILPFKPDYLILGQHFTSNEYDGVYLGNPGCTTENMQQYIRQLRDAVNTGVFSYIAHPDLPNISADDQAIKKAAYEICEIAGNADIPLECNLLGIMGKRWYPKEVFFKAVGETGCPVILGLDAHSPDSFICQNHEKNALEMLQRCGITPIEKLNLRSPF